MTSLYTFTSTGVLLDYNADQKRESVLSRFGRYFIVCVVAVAFGLTVGSLVYVSQTETEQPVVTTLASSTSSSTTTSTSTSTVVSGLKYGDEYDSCVCIEQYDPVCAGGITYSNKCFAGCAGNSKKNDITNGPCIDACVCDNSNDNDCLASIVCDENGVRYFNNCYLKNADGNLNEDNCPAYDDNTALVYGNEVFTVKNIGMTERLNTAAYGKCSLGYCYAYFGSYQCFIIDANKDEDALSLWDTETNTCNLLPSSNIIAVNDYENYEFILTPTDVIVQNVTSSDISQTESSAGGIFTGAASAVYTDSMLYTRRAVDGLEPSGYCFGYYVLNDDGKVAVDLSWQSLELEYGNCYAADFAAAAGNSKFTTAVVIENRETDTMNLVLYFSAFEESASFPALLYSDVKAAKIYKEPWQVLFEETEGNYLLVSGVRSFLTAKRQRRQTFTIPTYEYVVYVFLVDRINNQIASVATQHTSDFPLKVAWCGPDKFVVISDALARTEYERASVVYQKKTDGSNGFVASKTIRRTTKFPQGENPAVGVSYLHNEGDKVVIFGEKDAEIVDISTPVPACISFDEPYGYYHAEVPDGHHYLKDGDIISFSPSFLRLNCFWEVPEGKRAIVTLTYCNTEDGFDYLNFFENREHALKDLAFNSNELATASLTGSCHTDATNPKFFYGIEAIQFTADGFDDDRVHSFVLKVDFCDNGICPEPTTTTTTTTTSTPEPLTTTQASTLTTTTTTTTAAITYNLCNGDPIPVAVEDEIFISDGTDQVTLEVNVDPSQQVPDAVVYYWTYNGFDIVAGLSESEGGNSITLGGENPEHVLLLGDYTVTAFNTESGCFSDTVISVIQTTTTVSPTAATATTKTSTTITADVPPPPPPPPPPALVNRDDVSKLLNFGRTCEEHFTIEKSSSGTETDTLCTVTGLWFAQGPICQKMCNAHVDNNGLEAWLYSLIGYNCAAVKAQQECQIDVSPRGLGPHSTDEQKVLASFACPTECPTSTTTTTTLSSTTATATAASTTTTTTIDPFPDVVGKHYTAKPLFDGAFFVVTQTQPYTYWYYCEKEYDNNGYYCTNDFGPRISNTFANIDANNHLTAGSWRTLKMPWQDWCYFYAGGDIVDAADTTFCGMADVTAESCKGLYNNKPNECIEMLEILDVSTVESFYKAFFLSLHDDKDVMQEWIQPITLENWDVSSATTLKYMFDGSKKHQNLNVAKWNVAKVKNFEATFYTADNVQGLDNWDVSSGEIFQSMFYSVDNIGGDLRNWDVSKGTNFNEMFGYVLLSNNLDLRSWDLCNAQGDSAGLKGMFYSTYDYSATAEWKNHPPSAEYGPVDFSQYSQWHINVDTLIEQCTPQDYDEVAKAYSELAYSQGVVPDGFGEAPSATCAEHISTSAELACSDSAYAIAMQQICAASYSTTCHNAANVYVRNAYRDDVEVMRLLAAPMTYLPYLTCSWYGTDSNYCTNTPENEAVAFFACPASCPHSLQSTTVATSASSSAITTATTQASTSTTTTSSSTTSTATATTKTETTKTATTETTSAVSTTTAATTITTPSTESSTATPTEDPYLTYCKGQGADSIFNYADGTDVYCICPHAAHGCTFGSYSVHICTQNMLENSGQNSGNAWNWKIDNTDNPQSDNACCWDFLDASNNNEEWQGTAETQNTCNDVRQLVINLEPGICDDVQNARMCCACGGGSTVAGYSTTPPQP